MKIVAGSEHSPARQRPRTSQADHAAPDGFSRAMMDAASDDGQAAPGTSTQPNFTSMTRAELLDWANGRIVGGEMSLDQGSAFMAMTIKIPVEAGQATWRPLDDDEMIDVRQIAKDGIVGALSRDDEVTRKKLESALQAMQRARVDQRA